MRGIESAIEDRGLVRGADIDERKTEDITTEEPKGLSKLRGRVRAFEEEEGILR